jgi:hypothetical protein
MFVRKNPGRFPGVGRSNKNVHDKSLLVLIARRNVNIITTSHAFVFIKYGIEIRSAIKLIITPAKILTWRIMK